MGLASSFFRKRQVTQKSRELNQSELQEVFQFIPLHELLTTSVRVCKRWRKASYELRSHSSKSLLSLGQEVRQLYVDGEWKTANYPGPCALQLVYSTVSGIDLLGRCRNLSPSFTARNFPNLKQSGRKLLKQIITSMRENIL